MITKFYKLQKEFNRLLKELKSTPGVLIVSEPKEVDFSHVVGSDFYGHNVLFIRFLYCGFIYAVTLAPNHMDSDVRKHWMVMVERLVDGFKIKQASYWQEFMCIEHLTPNQVSFWIDEFGNIPLYDQPIDVDIARKEHHIIMQIVRTHGGYREHEIMMDPPGCHICLKSETWNEDHKVVNVLATTPEPDGHFPGFQVDLITRKICG